MFLVFLYNDFQLFSYHSVCSTLFLHGPLATIRQNYSSVVHSDLKNHNVLCKKIKCKGDWCNIASV